MGILQKIFGGGAKGPVRAGDKVRDLRGNVLLVTAVEPRSNGGPDTIRVRDVHGKEKSFALIGNEFALVDKNAPLAAAPSQFQRVHADIASGGVYLRGDLIVLHGWCSTNSGNFMCGPYVPLAVDVTDAVLGTELLRVLKEATAMPIPEDLKSESQKLFRLFGVRSWSKLGEGAVSCSVEQTPREFSFMPTRNEGRGFSHLPDRKIKTATQSSPADIGKSLRDCFKLCT